MSGRDLRAFVTTHRSKDIDGLVVHMRNGLHSRKYRPVDYLQLRTVTEAKKQASADIQLKVKKTEQAAKITKELMLIKQHRQVWWKEHQRLTEARIKADSELKTFLDDEIFDCKFLLDMGHFDHQLSEDREMHKTTSVDPIWLLREDLKHRMLQQRYHSSQVEEEFSPNHVLEQVNIVKKQQKAIIERLNLERLILEEGLRECNSKTLLLSSEEMTEGFQEVPNVLNNLDCPYSELKASVLREFHNINEEYTSRVQEIDDQLAAIEGNDCGWNFEDHWIFHTVLDQYPSHLQNRRTLYLDMLQRLLPHKSRHELVAHEKHWDSLCFTRNQQKVLIDRWARDRKNLLVKGIMAIAEACAAYDTEQMLADDRKRQQKICTELKEKVLHWRAQQEEVARLEAAGAARRKENEEEKERLRKEKEKLQRAEEKEKIQKYYLKKQQARDAQERKDMQRLEELKTLMEQQAIQDRDRVIFRQELLEKRLQEKKEMALQEAHEEELRQRRLDALRQQVAVVAEFDPVRMMGDTESSKAKLGIGAEEEFLLQKPLFKLHTYSEQQIISDPRIRIEMALREAGLHNTGYAKEILPKIAPPKLPRRDMESTVFKT
ncbi:coiled-coil domain-containing protein 148 isoform X1 [Pleurodeles waltl]|uniref:coiled-coil domain-containing protein 148 isoform X1 n=2 Tax=Pleurodeles waltl TaxID=8319 RepID=UPI003709B04C